MSTIKVEVCTILEIKPHGNADALELATVQGWQMCVKKGVHQPGDLVVYFEQGTVLTEEVAERLCVGAYLSEKTDINGDRVSVVHRIKLRGEPSFGLVVHPEAGMQLGEDVADFYKLLNSTAVSTAAVIYHFALIHKKNKNFKIGFLTHSDTSYNLFFTKSREILFCNENLYLFLSRERF